MATATFKSRNNAVKFLSEVSKNGISGRIVSLESGKSQGGCSFGVKLDSRWTAKAKEIALKKDVLPERWM